MIALWYFVGLIVSVVHQKMFNITAPGSNASLGSHTGHFAGRLIIITIWPISLIMILAFLIFKR